MSKCLVLALLLCGCVECATAARPIGPHTLSNITPDTVMGRTVKFDFQQVAVAQVIGLVYLEALKQPYVIDPAVLRDERLVSFRFDASQGDLKTFWRNFLEALGFAVDSRNGVDFVVAKPAPKEEHPKAVQEVYIYHPQYRSLSYLSDILTPLFTSGGFTTSRTVHASGSGKIDAGSAIVSQTSAAALIDHDADTLIFQGSNEEIDRLQKLLPQVDTPYGEVVVKAVIYEVNTSANDGTAVSLALNILGGKFGLKIGSDTGTLSNAITFKSANIDAALSILAGDARFKTISTPQVRVKSGVQAKLTVGQDVPTLGAVSYPQGSSQAVQSVEYRSSGVILGLTPTVRGSAIDVAVDQQISDFAKTETGVNNSPTLTKRALSSTITARDGELIVMGGLVQDKDSESHTGLSFLPRFLDTRSTNKSRTELLLLLQVSRLPNQTANRQ